MSAELLGHSLDVRSVAIANNYIVSGSRDKTAKVWEQHKYDFADCLNFTRNAAHANCRHFSSEFPDIFFSLNFLLSSTRSIYSGSYIDQFTLTSHTNFVSSVCLLDNGSYICTGSNDSTICVYAYGMVEPVTVLKGHTGTGTF